MANTIFDLRDYGYDLVQRLDYMNEDGIKVIIDASSLPQGCCKCCCGKCNDKEVDNETSTTEEDPKTEDTTCTTGENGLGDVVDETKEGEQCPSDTCLPNEEGETNEVKYSDLNDEINGTCDNNACNKP